MRLAWMIGLALAVAAVAAPADLGRELVPNGGFELDANGDGWPDGFAGERATVQWLTENGNRFVRLSRPVGQPGSAGVSLNLPLADNWFKLRVAVRVRLDNVVRGIEGWHDARVAMSFHNAAGEQVGGWPSVLNWTGTSDGWVEAERTYIIPDDSATLRMSCSLFTTTGTVDFDDLSVTVASLRPTLHDLELPEDRGPDWSLRSAARVENAHRGTVCLNGLWRFIPVMPNDPGGPVRPADGQGWGWLPVPGSWPSQGAEAHRPLGPEIWELTVRWTEVNEAWYERDLVVPREWAGRRIRLAFDLPQTQVDCYLAGELIGSVRWPAGSLDLTDRLQPGESARLSCRVTTKPFQETILSQMREDLVEEISATVRFRGLVGDVMLESEPLGPRLTTVQTRPSVADRALGLAVGLADLQTTTRYRLEATARDGERQVWRGVSQPFAAADLVDGQWLGQLPWAEPRLWSFDDPHLYDLEVGLVAVEQEQRLDASSLRFGFREIWLDGRDLLVNGIPTRLRALHFGGVNNNIAASSARGFRRTVERLKALGFNFVIFGNYGFTAGETAAFGDILRTADELGLGLSVSLPHAFRNPPGVDRDAAEAIWREGVQYVVSAAGNHPSVLTYAANHNTLGYKGDQNPEKIDGINEFRPEPGDQSWYARGFQQRREAVAAQEVYIRGLDPTREVYHHQSGHCGSWHTVNIYLCWAEAQERSEWLHHWGTVGVKPLFFVEWGLPHRASWGGHRQGPFIWRNNVNSEPLGIEYAAMLNGDRAYDPDPLLERYVDTYERTYARRQPFHISSVLGTLWESANETRFVELQTAVTDIVWPRMRTWGITAILPWDQDAVARRQGQAPAELPVPGYARPTATPGYQPEFERTGGDYTRSAWPRWELSSLGRSFERWNQPLLAYLAGSPDDFCERGHNVVPGETVTKQLIVVNDTSRLVRGTYRWQLSLGRSPVGRGDGQVTVEPGGQIRVPLELAVPDQAPAGPLTLSARFVPEGGAEQVDSFTFNVLAPPAHVVGEVRLYDPAGRSTTDLAAVGATVTAIEAETPPDLARGLVVGREAVTVDGALPEITALLAAGRRVLVLEQSEIALSRRLGFRTNNPSLRRVFPRVPDHPVLAGLSEANLADWRGDATLEPPRLDLPANESTDPLHDWLGFSNTRVWKAGNTGQVATVLIERPQAGDWLPVVEGGFDLQYAPLLLGRIGRGEILFCQMDVSGRTDADPAARRLLANLLAWVKEPATAQADRRVAILGAGDSSLLSRMGVAAEAVLPVALPGADVVLVPRHSGSLQTGVGESLAARVAAGATVICLPQRAEDLAGWLPFEPVTRPAALTVSAVPGGDAFLGIGPGDLRWRGRREVLTIGAPGVEPGVLVRVPHGAGQYLFCQIDPTDWPYEDEYLVYQKRTHNRTAMMLARLLANAGVPMRSSLLHAWSEAASLPLSLSGEWELAQAPATSGPGDLAGLTWQPVTVPSAWEQLGGRWADYDGVGWYRLRFDWTGPLDEPVELSLGAIDDEDWTWLNGSQIGHIGKDTHPDNHWAASRLYPVPPGLLRRTGNELLVKVADHRGGGGIVSGQQMLTPRPRWLTGLYLDVPAQLDDPYRYNRW